MLKKLMITTAIGGLMIGSAFAEGDKSSSPAPAAKSTEMTQPSSSASSAKFVSSQRQDQFLASISHATNS